MQTLDVLTLATCAYCHPGKKLLKWRRGKKNPNKKNPQLSKGNWKHLRKGRIPDAPFVTLSRCLRSNPHTRFRGYRTFVLTFFAAFLYLVVLLVSSQDWKGENRIIEGSLLLYFSGLIRSRRCNKSHKRVCSHLASCIWNYLTRARVRKMQYQVEHTRKRKRERAKWCSCSPLWFCVRTESNAVPLTAYLFHTNCNAEARDPEGGSPCLITPPNLLRCDRRHYPQHHNERWIEKQALVAHGAKGFPHAGWPCCAAKLPVCNRTDSHIHCWDGKYRILTVSKISQLKYSDPDKQTPPFSPSVLGLLNQHFLMSQWI